MQLWLSPNENEARKCCSDFLKENSCELHFFKYSCQPKGYISEVKLQ